MRKTLVVIVSVVEKSGLYLAMLLTLIMALHVAAEIVAYFYMVAVSFLPLGFCQAKGEHVSADAFVSVIPRSLRPYAEWLGKMLSVIVCLILLWATTDMAIRQTLLGEAVRSAYFDIPVWLSRWLVPLGLLSMVLVMLAQMFMPKEMQERHEQSEEYQHEQSPDY